MRICLKLFYRAEEGTTGRQWEVPLVILLNTYIWIYTYHCSAQIKLALWQAWDIFNLSPFSLHALASSEFMEDQKKIYRIPQISTCCCCPYPHGHISSPCIIFLINFTKLRQRVASVDDSPKFDARLQPSSLHHTQHIHKTRGAADLFPFPPSFVSPSVDSWA